ncbi:MAG: hypothetical protein LBD30_00685 [Verrucomicrobiales bacterium]|nr:hypothetical protein [Verrucomicrobiales bacterium]
MSDHAQTTAVADNTGTMRERYIYRAFGAVSYYSGDFTPQTNSNCDWTFLFGGYQLDQLTSLYQVRNRYYHTTSADDVVKD